MPTVSVFKRHGLDFEENNLGMFFSRLKNIRLILDFKAGIVPERLTISIKALEITQRHKRSDTDRGSS